MGRFPFPAWRHAPEYLLPRTPLRAHKLEPPCYATGQQKIYVRQFLCATCVRRHIDIYGIIKNLLLFQKSIILSNISLKNLLTELMEAFVREKRPVLYLLTNRLNQDVIKNLFGYIQAMAGNNNIPMSLNFRYRLRWYILGKHASHIITNHTNSSGHPKSIGILFNFRHWLRFWGRRKCTFKRGL